MRRDGLIAAAAIATLGVLLASPWHVRTGNIPTIATLFWTTLGLLTTLVNSIVWMDNIADRSPHWCDLGENAIHVLDELTTNFWLAVRIQVMYWVGLGSSSLAQMWRLHSIASTKRVRGYSAAERWRRRAFDVTLCFGFPALQVLLYWVIQGHRYDLFEGIGCWRPAYISWPEVVIMVIWPTLIACASGVFASELCRVRGKRSATDVPSAVLAMHHFIARRLQFASVLKASQSGLNTSQYLRLLALAMTNVLAVFASAISSSISHSHAQLLPYTSWSEVHAGFGAVGQYLDGFTFLSDSVAFNLISAWIPVIAAYVFFAFFGFTEEAVRMYVLALSTLRERLPRKSSRYVDCAEPNFCALTVRHFPQVTGPLARGHAVLGYEGSICRSRADREHGSSRREAVRDL